MGRMQGTYHVQIYAGGCIEKKHILCRVLLQGITCAVGKKLQHTNTDHYQQHSATVCVYVMLFPAEASITSDSTRYTARDPPQ
jgi:hypothetical protein